MPTILAMRSRLPRRVGALAGLIVLFAMTMPCAAADPTAGGAVLEAPTLSLADLGSDASLSFYGDTSSATVSVPVPTGLVPATLTATVELPFAMRYGLLTVTQDDRIISKVGLPLADAAPVVIPLDGAQVVDKALTVTLTLTALPGADFCLDQLNPVQLDRLSVSYTGAEVAPTTVAEFLPPVLHKLTIAVPSKPTEAESDAVVQLATALVARYRSQAPQVSVVALPDGANTLSEPSLPMERQLVVKEGPDPGLALTETTGVPSLMISGPPNQLTNQARLLTDSSLSMAVSPKVVAGELHPTTWLPGDSTTLAQLNQPAPTATGIAPQVGIALDQTRFGHPTQGFRVHLMGSYTPVPAAFGAQLTASVGGEVIDTWSTEGNGAIDRWIDVPDRLARRYTSLVVAVNTSGNTGRCGEFRPITLRIAGSTVVESTPAQPPIPPGFGSLPQALMPHVQVGLDATNFADTVRAVQVAVGLQRLSVVPLSTTVTSVDKALGSTDPAIIVSPDGWSDTSITLPVSANDRTLTLAGFNPGDQPTTLTLDPAVRFGSLQTVFTGKRSLLIATSNGAANKLDDLLRWLDDDPQRWSQLSGSAVVAVTGQEPASVPGRTPASVYGPPGSTATQANPTDAGHSATGWWIAGGVLAALAAGAVAIRLRARRSQSHTTGSGRHGNGHP